MRRSVVARARPAATIVAVAPTLVATFQVSLALRVTDASLPSGTD